MLLLTKCLKGTRLRTISNCSTWNNFREVLALKKILTVLIACILLSSCNSDKTSVAELDEVSDLVFNKGYGEEEVLEMVDGVYYEDLEEHWGEHGGLSGFWGDIWVIENGESKKQIIVYYNSDGFAKHVIIDDIKSNTEKQDENLQTDENGNFVADDPPLYESEDYFDIVNDGYTASGVLGDIKGVNNKRLHELWGEPDGILFGFCGDIWDIGNNKQMIVYYDDSGNVTDVIIDEVKIDTDGNT